MATQIKPLHLLLILLFGALFMVLLLIRIGVFEDRIPGSGFTKLSVSDDFTGRDTWMNIIQNNNKIGFSHSRYARLDNGFRFNETLFMRINTMGMIQDIGLNTTGRLDKDFSLKSFDFEIASGRFNFSVSGKIDQKTLSLKTRSAGAEQNYEIKLSDDIYFTSGIVQAASAADLKAGEQLILKVFDPIGMGQESLQLRVLENENITIMGKQETATKISLDFKGATQLAWIDKNGDILREEGMLGIILEKTTREGAMHDIPIQSSQDLTKAASIPANIDIAHPHKLKQMQFQITADDGIGIQLDGGRQTYSDSVLTVVKESLSQKSVSAPSESDHQDLTSYLAPSPFIQSQHPAIIKLATRLVSDTDTPLEKVRNLVSWIQENIKRQPVLSLPDALSTLENRMGDCNEHAVLFAALARAAGIPVKIEAGVVYLRGRFYYHAWNSFYDGRWITVDALFDQIPADVTHIRLAHGMQKDQLDILNLIGKLKIQIMGGVKQK